MFLILPGVTTTLQLYCIAITVL